MSSKFRIIGELRCRGEQYLLVIIIGVNIVAVTPTALIM
jgi:hypothetical protein